MVTFETDSEIKRRKSNELGLSRGVMSLKRLGTLDLGPKDHFALDDALPLQFARVSELFLGAAEGILCGAPQGLGPQNMVVGDRDLIGHGLVGAVGLQPRDFSRQARLLVPAETAPEVEEQPLDLQLRELKIRPNVESEG